MFHSDAVGVDILCDTSGDRPFGMGLIEFPPHGEVSLHVHEGSHILVCFDGEALVRVQVCDSDGSQRMVTHSISIGQCYNIESMVPHSVHAGASGVLLLVVGNDYRMAANQDRLEVVNG
jgi:mannose-6-phosphate isomerase-like protein (cupin superfamily)